MCRVGLFLTLRELINSGQEVLVTPYTIHDVVNMVLCAGGVPRFVDISSETLTYTSREFARHLSSAVGAVIATHIFGCAEGISEIASLCHAKGIPLIEDCAQALGARVQGRHVGTWGDVGLFSFGMAKNLNVFRGGIVITRDGDLAARVRSAMEGWKASSRSLFSRLACDYLIRRFLTRDGVFSSFVQPFVRWLYLHGPRALEWQLHGERLPRRRDRLPDHYQRQCHPLMRDMATAQFMSLDQHAAERLQYAEAYRRGLDGIPAVQLPLARHDGSHIYLAYPIQVGQRDSLIRYLVDHGRDITSASYSDNSSAACFREYRADCPVARQAAASVVLLPTYPGYGLDQVHANLRLIRSYFSLKGGEPACMETSASVG
jgi:dTDP-4-amino-4,6-dideoxygalactose transaminase